MKRQHKLALTFGIRRIVSVLYLFFAAPVEPVAATAGDSLAFLTMPQSRGVAEIATKSRIYGVCTQVMAEPIVALTIAYAVSAVDARAVVEIYLANSFADRTRPVVTRLQGRKGVERGPFYKRFRLAIEWLKESGATVVVIDYLGRGTAAHRSAVRTAGAPGPSMTAAAGSRIHPHTVYPPARIGMLAAAVPPVTPESGGR